MGPAVALLKTASGSPFYFNFHYGDLGNTFMCGPSGTGKTVIINFMLSQLENTILMLCSSTRIVEPTFMCGPPAEHIFRLKW